MTGMRINKRTIIGIILTCSLFLTNIVSAQTVSNSISNPSDTTSYNSANVDEQTIISDKQKLNEQAKNQTSNNNNRAEEKIVNEVVENREEYSKHFKLETGTYIAVSYTEPVNYLKDGKWEEIDNTLTAGTDKELGDIFQNKSNSYKAIFSKSVNSSRLVTMQKDQYSISWSLNTKKNSGILNTEAEVKNSDSKEKNLTNNEKMMDASKSRSTVTYKSVLPDIDLRYTVAPEKIKEDIVINKISTISSFIFDISAPGLKARLNEDNSITFFNPEKKEDEIFNIPTPFMMDSSEEQTFSEDVNLLLTETKDGYELEITPDAKWINAPERVFPIYIDPTTSASSTQSSAVIADTHIHSGDVAGEHRLSATLRFGKHAVDGITRTYIKTDLPAINGTVFDAKLNLSNTGGSSTFQNINVYRVDVAWSSSTLTWATAPTSYQTLVTYNIPVSAYVNNPSSYRYSCDITYTVQQFYNGALTNNGFMIRYTNEDIPDYNAVYSSDCGMTNVMPVTIISYVYGETIGIEDNEFYYIKNVNSNKYLDVQGAGDENGTFLLQYNFNGASNQQFKFSYLGNGCYNIYPRHSTTNKVLDVNVGNDMGNGNINGTRIGIWSGTGAVNQQWILTRLSSGAYKISAKCSSNCDKGLAIYNNSTSSGEYINLWQYTATYQDWILEPVDSGDADYYFTARNFSLPESNAPINNINNMLSDLNTMNYYSYYFDNASASAIYNYIPVDKVVILHGHGAQGQICLSTPNGIEWLHGSFTPSGNDRSMVNYSYNELSKIKLIAFLSCNSGTVPSDGESLVNEAYIKGANCAIGFNIEVNGAEFYFEYFLDYIRQGQTIANALSNADIDFNNNNAYDGIVLAERPSNPAHRVIQGNTNRTINLNR